MTSSSANTIKHLKEENNQLANENESLRNSLGGLQRVVRALVSLQHSVERVDKDTNIFDLIHKILESALGAVDSDNGSMMLIDEETNELVFVEVIGETRDDLLNFRIPKGQGIVGWALASRKVRLVEDVRTSQEFSPEVDQHTGLATQSLICVPLYDEERPLGAIEAVNTRDGRPFNEMDVAIWELVGVLASRAIVRAEKAQG